MRTRTEAVSKLNELLETPEEIYEKKQTRTHFGYIELRIFLDWLYEGLPQSESELLTSTYHKNPKSCS